MHLQRKKQMIKDDDDIQDYVRLWVGLTDDEIDKAWRSVDYTKPWDIHRIEVARAIEQALKEKNA